MKKFIAAALAVGILFTGCGSENAKPPPAPEPQKQVEEKPVEISAEEKAKIEEEQKRAAEEKARLEAEEKKTAQERVQQRLQAEQERQYDLLTNGVFFNYVVEKVGEHKYKINVKTNLPDGMLMSVDLTNYYLLRRERGIGDNDMDISIPEHAQINKEVKSISYEKSNKVTVRAGEFSTEFSGNRLNAGNYELVIVSLVSSLQNKSIQSVIGVDGENLFGQGVIDTGSDKRIQL